MFGSFRDIWEECLCVFFGKEPKMELSKRVASLEARFKQIDKKEGKICTFCEKECTTHIQKMDNCTAHSYLPCTFKVPICYDCEQKVRTCDYDLKPQPNPFALRSEIRKKTKKKKKCKNK